MPNTPMQRSSYADFRLLNIDRSWELSLLRRLFKDLQFYLGMFTSMQVLSTLTLAAQIAFVLVLLDILLVKFKVKQNYWEPTRRLSKGALWFALLITGMATGGSLYFSEINGFAPCVLCWFQRIFIYPQVVLALVALWKKQERQFFTYSVPLSVIGLGIAAYQFLLQLGVANLPCPSGVSLPSCSQYFGISYGYITIPVTALTAFACLLMLAYLSKKKGSI